MQLTAKLIQLLPLQTGNGKNGQWKKQDIIVETDDQVLKVGSMLNISFDVESREYNGRWYTDVKAWKVEPAAGAGTVDRIPDDNVHFEEGQMEGGGDLPF